MLPFPGLELTDEHPRLELAAHVLALGTRRFVGLEAGLNTALARAREDGALLIGAHPYSPEAARVSPRGTARLAADPDWAREAVHRLELVHRHDFFHWVARNLLPAVPMGDFHRPEHLWRGRRLSAAKGSRRPCSSSCVHLTRIG